MCKPNAYVPGLSIYLKQFPARETFLTGRGQAYMTLANTGSGPVHMSIPDRLRHFLCSPDMSLCGQLATKPRQEVRAAMHDGPRGRCRPGYFPLPCFGHQLVARAYKFWRSLPKGAATATVNACGNGLRRFPRRFPKWRLKQPQSWCLDSALPHSHRSHYLFVVMGSTALEVYLQMWTFMVD